MNSILKRTGFNRKEREETLAAAPLLTDMTSLRSFSTPSGRQTDGRSSEPSRSRGCGLPSPVPRVVGGRRGRINGVTEQGTRVPPGESVDSCAARIGSDSFQPFRQEC